MRLLVPIAKAVVVLLKVGDLVSIDMPVYWKDKCTVGVFVPKSVLMACRR